MTDSFGAHGPNTIAVAGADFLISHGDKAHLVARVAGTGRPAAPDWWFDEPQDWHAAYDLAELRQPIWSERTVCGRDWPFMAIGEGPAIGRHTYMALSPDCKTCLRVITADLSTTPHDDRIPLVATLAVDEAIERSSAQVIGVPGDQVDPLRRAIVAEFKRRGHRCGTRLVGEMLFAWTEETLEPENQARLDEDLRLAMETTGEVDRPKPADRSIQWSTWG